MRVVNNVLEGNLFKKVQASILAPSTPWYISADVGDYGTIEEDIRQYSFHLPLAYGSKDMGVLPEIRKVLLDMMREIGEPVTELIRIRIGMHVWAGCQVINPPHIDSPFPHKVGLLYITDADSPTLLYSNRYEYGSVESPLEFIKGKALSILENIIPEENKLILFDGSYYHASTTPSKVAKRITINFNYN